MSNVAAELNEYDAITKIVQHYIDGAKSGKGDDMRPAFHKDATIFVTTSSGLRLAISSNTWKPGACRRMSPLTLVPARFAFIRSLTKIARQRMRNSRACRNWSVRRCETVHWVSDPR